MKKYLAELLGTYMLMFCGTGAVVINTVTNGAVSHAGIAVTFGLIVMVVVYAFGAISGAHINPAVTIAFSMTDRFDKKLLPGYIIAQLLGAVLASATLLFMFGNHSHLGATIPNGSWQQSFVLELILTYILLMVVFFVSQNPAVSTYTPAAAGATVLLEAWFAGPISGASMNPARSFAPAVVSGRVDELWIYLLAPVIGAILAMWTWKYLKEEEAS